MSRKELLFLLSFSILLLSHAIDSFAVPAYPHPIKFKQPDGSLVTITLKGDEKIRWAESTDGFSLLRNRKGGWEYASLNKDGDLVCSGILAKEVHDRTLKDMSFLQNTRKKLNFSKSQIGLLRQISNLKSTEASQAFPLNGNINLLMILVEYQDLKFTKTKTNFENLMNQVGYIGTGSFKDFYLENSYGNLTVNTTVAGIYTAANNIAYYGTNNPSDDYRVGELISEAVNFADHDVDFSDFDNDGDGKVDGVYIIYAGYGEEAGGGDDAIWAHASSIPSMTRDGVKVSKYACSCELRGNDGTEISAIGVICHEFGHSLGAPDYYDTDYDGNGQYPGTDSWDAMAGGSWNGNGDSPAHHNPYTKTKVYHWADATIIDNVQQVTLGDATTEPDFVQINTTTPNEYFLCENRQLNGFNASLPGHGMIIYHIDGDFVASHSYTINAGEHQGMYVVAANATTSNGVMLEGNINTDACPWPGTGNRTTFDDTTTPNSKSWAGENTDKAIVNIEENGGVITFCLIACDENVPLNFTALAISSSQIDLSWNLNSINDPVIVAFNTTNSFGTPVNGTSYSLGNSLVGGGTIIYKGSNATFPHSGLNSNTTYYYKIWTVMDGDVYSAGINGNATTLCGASILPYTEAFNGTTIPDCWSQIDHEGNSQIWQFGTTGSFGAGEPNLTDGNYAYLNSDQYGDGNTQNADLITPTIDMSGYSDITVSFQHFHQYWTGTAAAATFLYSTDDGSTWNQIQQWESTTTNPVTFSQIIPALSEKSLVRLKWNYTATYGGGWAIDDIRITGTPTVTVPVDFELTDRTVASDETVCFNAQNEITVAGNGSPVIFSDGSTETLIAGQSIRFLPGFHAQQGCAMDAYITTNGSFCDELSSPGSIVSLPIEVVSEKQKSIYEQKAPLTGDWTVKVYPNPSFGWVAIELDNLEETADIEIVNTINRIVGKIKPTDQGVNHVDLSYLPKGVYFVVTKNKNSSRTNKIILQ